MQNKLSESEFLNRVSKLSVKERQKIKAINKALTLGEKSGKSVSFDNDKFKSRMMEKVKIDS